MPTLTANFPSMIRNALPLEFSHAIPARNVRIYLFAVACFFLVSRIAFLNLNSAEFTDGYLILQWSFANPTRWHPLYPLLIKGIAPFMDSIIAGRLIAILAGFLTFIPLSQIATMLYGERAALIACLLFAVSPLNMWVESHVLTEPVFVLTSIFAFQFYLSCIREKSPSDFVLFSCFATLAFLTRPEGYIFLPLWLYAGAILSRAGYAKKAAAAMPVFLPAIAYLVWMQLRAPSETYEKTFSASLHGVVWLDVLQRLIAYAEIYPYAVFYPVFVLALLHFFGPARTRGHWPHLLAYANLILIPILGIHTAWSSRFLIIPATLILIEAAAMLDALGQKWNKTSWRLLLSVVVIGSFVLGIASLWGQRNVFSDFKSAGIQLAYDREARRIFSDEFTKTAFYANRALSSYNRNSTLAAGDLVVLHSFHTDLRAEWNYLNGRYDVECLSAARSEILPTLAGVPLSKDYLTNNPVASLERFRVQKFQTVILHIRGLRPQTP